MQILHSDNVLYVDVDETLILWGNKEHEEDREIIVDDPYLPGKKNTFVAHQRNIDLVIRNKNQGKHIIVWSAGGYRHAEEVVKALEMEQYVDLILSKPTSYVDDLSMSDWGCKRVYLGKQLPKHP